METDVEVITDDDLTALSRSDRECEGCTEPLAYGDPCVMLRLVCPVQKGTGPVLLDAVENDGGYMAEPLIFCAPCWEAYDEDLHAHQDDLFLTGQKSNNPSPLMCAYCQTHIGWGNCATHVVYGSLDTSPRTQETVFQAVASSTDSATLLCMNCLNSLNDICDESIWTHLWEED